MSARKTQAAWSRANEAKRLQAGGRRMPGGLLRPNEAQALDKLREAGYAATLLRVIGRALLEAEERLPR